jgi:hypothetical protein
VLLTTFCWHRAGILLIVMTTRFNILVIAACFMLRNNYIVSCISSLEKDKEGENDIYAILNHIHKQYDYGIKFIFCA